MLPLAAPPPRAGAKKWGEEQDTSQSDIALVLNRRLCIAEPYTSGASDSPLWPLFS